LGIGLTLVRRLVELHGGSVTAHSSGRGEGTEFVVRLPLQGARPLPDLPEVPEDEVETMEESLGSPAGA
jgi:K+-sensing histidine kinase KdpD